MNGNTKKVRIKKTLGHDAEGLPEIEIDKSVLSDNAEGENVFCIQEVKINNDKIVEICIDEDPQKKKIYKEIVEGCEVDKG